MRILMLTELYPPYIGGSEEYVRNLGLGLHVRGHDVAVATLGPAERPRLTDDDGLRVHRLSSSLELLPALMPSGRPYAPPVPDPLVVRSLRDVLRREQPDIVHAHNWLVHSFLPLKGSTDARLVMTLHDYGVVCAKRSLMYRERACSGPALGKCLHCAADNYGTARGMLVTLGDWAMRGPLQRAVDKFVPVTRAVADGNELDRAGVPYEIVPNFVPDDVAQRADASDPALAALPDGPFWLYVGALSRHKGIDVLLDAYRQTDGAPPLVVIGRDSGEPARDYPDDVIVLRNLGHAAVMAAWQRAGVGFIPSLFPDPCPTVAIEAMACGVPVVASRTGGLPDLVDDRRTGVLVEPGDVGALRDVMGDIVHRRLRTAAMGKRALARAPEFMAERVVGRIEQVYGQVMA